MKQRIIGKALAVAVIILFTLSAIPTIGIPFDDDTTPPVTVHSLDPSEPTGINGWYIDEVTVTLNATDDLSGVKEIRYIINGWSEHIIPGDNCSFILFKDGEDILIEYWAIDNAGNVEPKNEFELDIDQTRPEVTLTYEFYNRNWWKFWQYPDYDWEFTANATDYESGMDRVEFYLNNELQETVTGAGPIYIWTPWILPPCKLIIRATAYDKAGLFASDEIQEPKTTSNNHLKNIKQGIENINYLRISSIKILEVLLRIINL
jgi:hypothetical protein